MSGRGQARVGCSGWSYADWRGLVYADDLPQHRWFGRYAAAFGVGRVWRVVAA